MPSESPLKRAVRLAGSQAALARKIGRPQQTVNDWVVNGRPVPPVDAQAIERETGVPKEQLRPDIYPPQLAAQPPAPTRDQLEGVRT
ncbi:helix-turn-helix domain-containing protein [Sphingomonas sp. MG17]|uniref:Helix-turn-helix domain-containing protein n=2 Tax=Sphingomonas tagetis TaxID=2949092 RepID=A0A9X2KK70_9SPHN|nr:helix-turn-helix domain-containing protein [Sphingomonas tagetis]